MPRMMSRISDCVKDATCRCRCRCVRVSLNVRPIAVAVVVVWGLKSKHTNTKHTQRTVNRAVTDGRKHAR